MRPDDAEGDDPAPARQLAVVNRQNACRKTAQDEADRDPDLEQQQLHLVIAE